MEKFLTTEMDQQEIRVALASFFRSFILQRFLNPAISGYPWLTLDFFPLNVK